MEKRFADEEYLNNIVEQIKNIEISNLQPGKISKFNKFFNDVDKALNERKAKYKEEFEIFEKESQEEDEYRRDVDFYQR